MKTTAYAKWQVVADGGRTHPGFEVAGGRPPYKGPPFCHQPRAATSDYEAIRQDVWEGLGSCEAHAAYAKMGLAA